MKITKEQYDALTTEQKKLWKAAGDQYELVGDTEVAAEMRRARDREKSRADKAETDLAELTTRLSTLEGDSARKTGDIATIEKSWQTKLDAAKGASDKTIGGLKKQLEVVMIDGALATVAAEIFTKPTRDVRLLKDRVYVDYDGETPVLRVRDKDGKASALTLEDLKKETVDNPDFKDILVGSKATGSGGAGGNQGGGATKQPKDYSEQERVQLFHTDPTKFKELFPQSAA